MASSTIPQVVYTRAASGLEWTHEADLDDEFIFPVRPLSFASRYGSLPAWRLQLCGDQLACDWVDGVPDTPLCQGHPRPCAVLINCKNQYQVLSRKAWLLYFPPHSSVLVQHVKLDSLQFEPQMRCGLAYGR